MKNPRLKGKGVTTKQGYENLANAIVLLAVEDYRRVLRRLSEKPNDRSALSTKQHVETFFRSAWFSTLTSLNCEVLIEQLKDEVA